MNQSTEMLSRDQLRLKIQAVLEQLPRAAPIQRVRESLRNDFIALNISVTACKVLAPGRFRIGLLLSGEEESMMFTIDVPRKQY